MSIRARRDSLRKSSIGIDSIRKSVTNLSEGLLSIGRQSSELLKQTRKTNLFKSKLIRQDAEFFKRRRENVLRRQREDELEASSVSGVTKRQGNVISRSTKGFLGRILDFVGTLIIGWALLNLPKIIKAFEKLFKLITRVVGVFTGFIEGMSNFFESISTGVDNFLSQFKRFDFREDDKQIRETIDESEATVTKLNKDFIESVNDFARDKDIASAGEVAKKIGVTEGVGDFDPEEEDFTPEQENEVLNSIEGSENENLAPVDFAPEIEGRAEGGEVSGQTPYIVGEEGPELFVPTGGGEIVPNDQLVLQDNEEAVADSIGDASNIEGVGSEETPLSVTPEKPSNSRTATTAAAPPMSSFDSDYEQSNVENKPVSQKVEPQKLEKSIIPIKREVNKLKGKRKPRTTLIISGQNDMPNTQIRNIPQKSSVKVISGHNSKQTLLDFQSVILK